MLAWPWGICKTDRKCDISQVVFGNGHKVDVGPGLFPYGAEAAKDSQAPLDLAVIRSITLSNHPGNTGKITV